jgi:F-type H+-transporting ATPase subunit epsilon
VKLEIITPERNIFKGEVTSLALPGSNGKFMILNNHAPIISTLIEGDLIYTTSDSVKQTIAIKGGVIEVKQNVIIVLAEL